MPCKLLNLADQHGIMVLYWAFPPPLEGIYLHNPGLPPVIGLGRHLLSNYARLRSVLAEELGHHFTTIGKQIPEEHYSYGRRLVCGQAEYRARKWAALHLMPEPDLTLAIKSGIVAIWDLAEYFRVSEEMAKLRLYIAQRESEDFIRRVL